MSHDDPKELTAEIMRAARIAALTYRDDQGRLVSTPMGTQDFEDPATIYFITEKDSDKVRHITANPEVNVFYSSNEGYVSLSGTAAIVEDPQRLEELWGAMTDSFMEGGPEDPNSGLLEVRADTAQYWSSPGKAAMVVSLIKARLSDETTDLGDSGIVDL